MVCRKRVNASEQSSRQAILVPGKFLIPGLMNSHVHLATLANPSAARAYLLRELYSGVTAVRDMAGDARLLGELKREAEFDEIQSPDIYDAAVIAGPQFFTGVGPPVRGQLQFVDDVATSGYNARDENRWRP
jgi:hypothetical protein